MSAQHTDIDKQYESGNLQKYHPGGTAIALAADHFATAFYFLAQNSQSQWVQPSVVYSAKET